MIKRTLALLSSGIILVSGGTLTGCSNKEELSSKDIVTTTASETDLTTTTITSEITTESTTIETTTKPVTTTTEKITTPETVTTTKKSTTTTKTPTTTTKKSTTTTKKPTTTTKTPVTTTKKPITTPKVTTSIPKDKEVTIMGENGFPIVFNPSVETQTKIVDFLQEVHDSIENDFDTKSEQYYELNSGFFPLFYDFTFYGTRIDGVSYSDLTLENKEKIYNMGIELEDLFDQFYPKYKQTLTEIFETKDYYTFNEKNKTLVLKQFY